MIYQTRRKQKKDLLVMIIAISVVLLATLFSIKKIHQREDLTFLQIDLMETVNEAIKCHRNKGFVQDASQGREGDVFICSKQDIVKSTFPSLKDLSGRGINYKYLSPIKCFDKNCEDKNNDTNRNDGADENKSENYKVVQKINIGRGSKLVLSCDITNGICRTK